MGWFYYASQNFLCFSVGDGAKDKVVASVAKVVGDLAVGRKFLPKEERKENLHS
jgi:hypothetical protein